ncbi:kinase-like domain-containing protein [Syncephalis plumigaleata]|nr:kinase-like domain-containing protein [Syncephalis plumigaleata]
MKFTYSSIAGITWGIIAILCTQNVSATPIGFGTNTPVTATAIALPIGQPNALGKAGLVIEARIGGSAETEMGVGFYNNQRVFVKCSINLVAITREIEIYDRINKYRQRYPNDSQYVSYMHEWFRVGAASLTSRLISKLNPLSSSGTNGQDVARCIIAQYAGNTNLNKYFGKSIQGKEQAAYTMFFKIFRGVRFLHTIGIAHNDIKPDNIMVITSANGVANPVIIDFDLGTQLYTTFGMKKPLGRPLGSTFSFAPPEYFLRGVDYDLFRADTWMIAASLYRLAMESSPLEYTLVSTRTRLGSLPLSQNREILEKYGKGEFPVVLPANYLTGAPIPPIITRLLGQILVRNSAQRPTPAEFLEQNSLIAAKL